MSGDIFAVHKFSWLSRDAGERQYITECNKG